MGRRYEQLDLGERIEIYRLHAEGRSLRVIAAALERSAATISRELRRNGRPTKAWPGGYDAARAQSLAQRRRRWDGRFKLARQPDLRELVRQRLAMGLSPEQIAGRLAREQGRTVISHEAIYRFIYHRCAQADYWHRLLPRRKSRRGRLGQRGGSPASFIHRRRPIADRPDIADRTSPGHWEVDAMAFSTGRVSILLAVERTSRLLLLTRQVGKTAATVAANLMATFRDVPTELRRSLTFDNGTEFALHYRVADRLGCETFFCDPHHPWQKGSVENAIGRLRRFLPRRSNIATFTTVQLQRLVQSYNDTPRKCLAFRTPNEAFSELQTVALQT